MEEEVLAAERELQRAVLEGDIGALEELLADDALYIVPDGAKSDKEADLRYLRSRSVVFIRLEASDTEVHIVSPDVALLRVRLSLTLLLPFTPHEGTYRYLRVYAKRNGRWQVVFAQSHVD